MQCLLKPEGIRAHEAEFTGVCESPSSVRVASPINHQAISLVYVPFLYKEVSIICEINLFYVI